MTFLHQASVPNAPVLRLTTSAFPFAYYILFLARLPYLICHKKTRPFPQASDVDFHRRLVWLGHRKRWQDCPIFMPSKYGGRLDENLEGSGEGLSKALTGGWTVKGWLVSGPEPYLAVRIGQVRFRLCVALFALLGGRCRPIAERSRR